MRCCGWDSRAPAFAISVYQRRSAVQFFTFFVLFAVNPFSRVWCISRLPIETRQVRKTKVEMLPSEISRAISRANGKLKSEIRVYPAFVSFPPSLRHGETSRRGKPCASGVGRANDKRRADWKKVFANRLGGKRIANISHTNK